jgi:predicted DNA-binding ribbon-helix-helix protein
MALTKRGGFMPGGGRPKGSTTGRGVTQGVTFKTETWEAIEKAAKERYTTPSKLIRGIVEEKIAEWERGEK